MSGEIEKSTQGEKHDMDSPKRRVAYYYDRTHHVSSLLL